MANLGKSPADPLDAELWRLSRMTSINWDRELAKCPELLALIPKRTNETLEPAKRLKAAMDVTANRAYDFYLDEESAERSAASEILAGAALIGVISLVPDKVRDGERLTSRVKRSEILDMRRTVAGSWRIPRVAAATFMKHYGKGKSSYEDESLDAFRNALINVLREAIPVMPGEDMPLKAALTQSAERLAKPCAIHASSDERHNPDCITLGEPCVTSAYAAPIFEPSPEYVHREVLYNELDRLLATKTKCVSLIGEGGTGKSTLSRNFVFQRFGTSKSIIIDATSDQKLHASIRDEFDRLRLPRPEAGYDAAILALRSIIKTPPHGSFAVVIDNINDPDRIAVALPDKHSAIVVLTARPGVLPKGFTAEIPVGSMTTAEAREMAKQQGVTFTDKQLDELHNFLHGRALAIDQVCAFLKGKNSVAIDTLFATLRLSLVDTLDNLADATETQSFRVIYKELLSTLSSSISSTASLRLLELMAFTGTERKPTGVLKGALAETLGIANIGEVVEVEFYAAIAVLERYHLVSVADFRDANGVVIAHHYSMHELTQEVLRSLFADCASERLECMFRRLFLRRQECFGMLSGIINIIFSFFAGVFPIAGPFDGPRTGDEIRDAQEKLAPWIAVMKGLSSSFGCDEEDFEGELEYSGESLEDYNFPVLSCRHDELYHITLMFLKDILAPEAPIKLPALLGDGDDPMSLFFIRSAVARDTDQHLNEVARQIIEPTENWWDRSLLEDAAVEVEREQRGDLWTELHEREWERRHVRYAARRLATFVRNDVEFIEGVGYDDSSPAAIPVAKSDRS